MTARTWRVSLCGLGLILAWALPSMAQRGGRALEPREAQFVFIIDDSGSMSQNRTDPDRLAVFAVRALLGVLDDRDWVSVVRLNGPREGEQPPPLAPLSDDHRKRVRQVLDLGGKLAEYGGRYTPCRSDLEVAHDVL
ncbi:MAG: VWA domain-containing protein, partial [bacterium]|nr:VWA domain-containing protein [bacterium]